MLLPETLSILSKNPIFIALYNVVTTYFILAQSLDLNIIFTLSLHCALAVAQCIVIGAVCVCVCVCYHDNLKLRASISILTKLGL